MHLSPENMGREARLFIESLGIGEDHFFIPAPHLTTARLVPLHRCWGIERNELEPSGRITRRIVGKFKTEQAARAELLEMARVGGGAINA